MTREQVDKLLEVVDAKIAEANARHDWDGGLHETIRVSELTDELRAMFPEESEE
ncbi:hypothetical protein D3C87_1867620 [compost metagenome]